GDGATRVHRQGWARGWNQRARRVGQEPDGERPRRARDSGAHLSRSRALAGSSEMKDIAVIVVSTNEAKWLRPCLTTVLEHQGSCSLDLIVVDNESSDGTPDLVTEEFPTARIVRSKNLGFAH